MRAAWIAGLALGLLAAAGVAAADDASDDASAKPPPTRQGTTWTWSQLGGLFGGADKAPAPTITVEKPAATRPAAASRAISPVQKETRDLAREEAAFTRRLAVCDKLKQIAMETNDPKLQHEAELLEERATSVYHQRTDHLADTVRTPAAVEQLPDDHAPEPATPGPVTSAPVHAVSGQVHQAAVPDSLEDNP